MIKINDRFEFPENLDLIDYVADEKKEQETKYQLFGVLIHIGSGAGGHYEALMKVNGQWMIFNDDSVTPTTSETLETTYGSQNQWGAAYFLSYVKVSELESFKQVSNDELPQHLKNFYQQWVEENTWKDFLNIGHSTELGVYITNPTDNADVHVEIYFDNFRIVPAAKQKD